MSFWIEKKRDGTLVVPLVAFGDRDLVGDGIIEVKRDAPDYQQYFKMYQEEQESQGLPIPDLKKNLLKAESNPQLTPQGRQALSLTEDLEDDIRQRWARLMANVEAGVPVSQALASYEQDALGLIASGMREAWLVGHAGPIREAEQKVIDEAIASQQDYLEKFMKELEGELRGAADDDRGGMLLGSASRAILYAGSIWTLYNLSKVFGEPKTSIYEWRGPSDSRSCAECVEEVKAGPRPLSKIKRFPGEASCLSRCRHELVRVK